MKKLLTLAAIALCAFATQAVTVAWEGSVNALVPVGSDTTGGGNIASSFANFRITDNPKGYGNVTRIGVAIGSSTGGTYGPKWSTDTYAVICIAGADNTTWDIIGTSNARTFANGDHADKQGYPGHSTALMAVFDFDTALTLDANVDYRLFFAETAPTGLTFDIANAVDRSIAGRSNSLVDGLPTTTLDNVATNAYVAINGVMLPEPTALALLALGVAGLALKRKVA